MTTLDGSVAEKGQMSMDFLHGVNMKALAFAINFERALTFLN